MYPLCTLSGSILDPKRDPKIDQKIDHFLYLFLNDFLEPLFDAFDLHLGSQNDPKMIPKRVPIRNQKIIDFAVIYCTCATLRGPENHHFWCFFGTLFKIPFRDLFFIDFGPFWGPFGHQKSTLKNTQTKNTEKRPKQSSP